MDERFGFGIYQVLDVCVGCGGVGRELVDGLEQGLERCESGFSL